MSDSHFELLLHAARSQPEPQRILLVFAAAALPADATDEQRARFEAGEGGELDPVMCVDKDPHALTTFASLVAESAQIGNPWKVVFVAGLSGKGQLAPTDADAERAINDMVEAIRLGMINRYAAYDARGEPLSFA